MNFLVWSLSNKYKKFNEPSPHSQYNGDAILFLYESIKLDEANDITSIKFIEGIIFIYLLSCFFKCSYLFKIKDKSCKHRYFAFHSTGVHAIDLTWLGNLQNSFKMKCNPIKFTVLEIFNMKITYFLEIDVV